MQKLEDLLWFNDAEGDNPGSLSDITGMPGEQELIEMFFEETQMNKSLVQAHVAAMNIELGKVFMVVPATVFRSVAQTIDTKAADRGIVTKAIMYHCLINELINYGAQLFTVKVDDYKFNEAAKLDPQMISDSQLGKEALANNTVNPNFN